MEQRDRSRLLLLGQYPPSVVLDKDMRLLDAIIALDERGVRYGVVVDNEGVLEGLLSIDDVLFHVKKGYDEYSCVCEYVTNTYVSDVMDRDPPKVLLGEYGVEEVMEELARKKTGALIVVDNRDRALGIISTKHILSIMALSKMHAAAHEVMDKHIPTLREMNTIYEALEIMVSTHQRYVPVVDEKDKPRAMVTARDIISFIGLGETLRKLDERRDNEVMQTRIEKIASASLVYINPTTSLRKTIRLMRKYGVSGLPVVGEDDYRLQGIVSEEGIVAKLPHLAGIEIYYDYAKARLYIARAYI